MALPSPLTSPKRSLAALLLPPPSTYLADLSRNLDQDRVQVMPVTQSEAFWQIFETNSVDLILAVSSSPQVIELFRTAHQSPALQRPALALIQEAAWQEQMTEWADLVLPALPAPAALHLLLAHLQMRASVLRLEDANRALIADNLRMKAAIDNRRQTDDEINLLKTAIVHNVSHELKTPLLQVKSAIALLAEEGGDVRTLIEYAMDATARLEGGVRNITLLNELLSDSLEFNAFGPVLFSEILEYALRNLRRSWEHKNRVERIRMELDDDLPPVHGNKQGLGIIMQLLLDNALKFSQDTVSVRVQRQDNQVNIAVEDQGIGIAPDKLEKIFDAFYQVENSSTRRYGGMGIGLAIVRYILDRHHSRIQVTSKLNQGSRFAFTLPIAEAPP